MKTKIITAILFGTLLSVKIIAQERIDLVTETANYEAQARRLQEIENAERQRKAAELKAQQDAQKQTPAPAPPPAPVTPKAKPEE